MLENYPTLSGHLDPDALIVLNPLFESGLLKIEDAREEGFTSKE